MVDAVERGMQRQTSQASPDHPSPAPAVGQYLENSCFHRVHCSIRRLKIWKQVVVLEVFHKLRANESLKQLRNDGQVRDRPVGLNVDRIKICFLQQRRNVSAFETRRDRAVLKLRVEQLAQER